MTTANQRYFTINDIPDSPGKRVLLEILNSPKADVAKLQKIATEYENKALEMTALEQKQKVVQKQ